ncbi:hypothetical protein QCA50_013174 [Cerrena zonata]|uniref:Hydrophobin n=1 Tax=Cerrena zonata TaxID=2478898 RepID=A0AAW0FQ36_9APHY
MVNILTMITISLSMILAEATPTRRDIPQCTAASLLCCQSVLPASDPVMSTLLGLLGIVVLPVSTKCGVQCDPVSVIGLGGNPCKANLVCCDNTSLLPIVAIGCAPIAISL